MRTVPRKRRQQSARRVSRRRARHLSRRTRRSLLLVFALIFAPAAARTARAACVEIGALPSIATGADTTPWSVISADVDGDGDDDAIVALYAGDAFVWYENDGAAGGWGAHTIASGTVADSAIRLIAADLDGDGDIDMATASFHAGIDWYENVDSAGGVWTLHTVADLYTSVAVAAADLDGDGDLDLVATGYFAGAVVWYANDGSGGGWAPVTISATAPLAYAVFAADLDGDGDLDVLDAVAGDDQIEWQENLAPGDGSSWAEHEISATANFASAVTAADFDADGDLDVAASSVQDAKVTWYDNDGTPASGTWTELVVSTSGGTISLAALDFDRDGDPDLAAGGSYFNESDTSSAWYENLGGGAWREHAVVTGGTALSGAAAGDLDGDGDADLLTVDRDANQIVISKNLALHDQALFASAAAVSSGRSPFAVASGDLDGDGDLDLLSSLSSDSTLAWFENAAPGGDGSSWTLRTVASTASATGRSVAADLDGDGDLDVLVPNYLTGVRWFENTAGDASVWSPHAVYSTAVYAFVAVAVDIDRDGDLDVVSALASDATIAWHEDTAPSGDGSTWTIHAIATGVDAPYAVVAADLDGDGDPDAASATFTGGAILWHRNLPPGNGSIWTTQTVSSEVSPTDLVAADVDHDGDLDLVSSAGSSSHQVAWHENLAGDGSTWTDHLIATGASSAGGIAAADADGDGDIDLFATAVNDHTVAWYENDGTPAVGSWSIHAIETTLVGGLAVAAADLDGDGDIDAASVVVNSNKLSWHRNLGTGVFDDGFDSDANRACWSSSVP